MNLYHHIFLQVVEREEKKKEKIVIKLWKAHIKSIGRNPSVGEGKSR